MVTRVFHDWSLLLKTQNWDEKVGRLKFQLSSQPRTNTNRLFQVLLIQGMAINFYTVKTPIFSLILAAGSKALALVVWSIPAAQLQADQATRGGTIAENLILLMKLQVRRTARFTENTASILGFDMNINIQGVLYTCWSHFQYWRKEWKIQKSPCLTMFQEQFVDLRISGRT